MKKYKEVVKIIEVYTCDLCGREIGTFKDVKYAYGRPLTTYICDICFLDLLGVIILSHKTKGNKTRCSICDKIILKNGTNKTALHFGYLANFYLMFCGDCISEMVLQKQPFTKHINEK